MVTWGWWKRLAAREISREARWEKPPPWRELMPCSMAAPGGLASKKLLKLAFWL